MTRIPSIAATVVALTLLGAAVGPTVPALAQRAQGERSVYVGALRDEKPVTDLTAADFTVREDGQNREVIRAATAPPPSHIALLVDDSSVTQPLTQDLRTGFSGFVRAFEDGQPPPAWAIYTFGDRTTRLQDYTTSVPTVLGNIAKIFHRSSAGATFVDAVIQASAELKKAGATRPIIVAFVAEEGPEFSTETADRAGAALAESGTSLWVIPLQSRTATDTATREGRERASLIGDYSRNSGGTNRAILSRQSIVPTFSGLASWIIGRYEVVYGRPEAMVPPKRIEVQTRRKDVRLLAPRAIAQ